MPIPPRLIPALLLPLLAACGAAESPPPAKPLRVSVVTVGQEAAAPVIEAAGTAALRKEIPLGFTTPGQIARITVQEGDRVQRGQVLATLDMTSVGASLEAAAAERDRAEAELNRLKQLYAQGWITKARLEAAEAAARSASANVSARNNTGVGGIAMLAVFGILSVLVLEFGRFREVTVVAGVVPLGLFGGLWALIITGNSLSYLAVIGFIALIGIEIKNSILLVDFTTQLRQQGMELMEAIERAGEIRFLPVLLTSVTAIGGLLPLALSGSPLYAPLAWVIIGGLVSSTLLSRIVIPAMYLLLVRGAPPPTS